MKPRLLQCKFQHSLPQFFYPVQGNCNALLSRQSDAISGTDDKLDQMIVPFDLMGPDWRSHIRANTAVMSWVRIPMGASQTFYFIVPQGNLLWLTLPTPEVPPGNIRKAAFKLCEKKKKTTTLQISSVISGKRISYLWSYTLNLSSGEKS